MSGVCRSAGFVGLFAGINAAELQLTKERHEPQAEHVERCKSGGEESHSPKNLTAMGAGKDLAKNFILGEESRKWRNTGNGNRGDRYHPECSGNQLAQPAHATHILLSAHGVNH